MQLMFFRASSEGFAITNGQNFADCTNTLSSALMFFKKELPLPCCFCFAISKLCKFRKLPLAHDYKLLVGVRHLTGS